LNPLNGLLGGAPLFGIEVRYDEMAVTMPWVFPADRYVEYGKEDEWWARKYGFGHPGPAEPCMYLVGQAPGRQILMIHPKLKEAFEREIAELNAKRPKPPPQPVFDPLTGLWRVRR
jgi:hypothetical protein